jgi:hypothetical protein
MMSNALTLRWLTPLHLFDAVNRTLVKKYNQFRNVHSGREKIVSIKNNFYEQGHLR